MGTSDRRPYETATVLDQDLLDESQDNLTNKLEMIAEIETSTGTLYLSDRAKYVNGVYYSPRVEFPLVSRTVGEWLAGELEFSDLTLKINNTDRSFSEFLPGGASFESWIGKNVSVSVGLGETLSTYTEIFSGQVTEVNGFQRDTATFTLVCRSDFEKVNVAIPNQVLIPDDWPDIEDNFVGLGAPIIYGDWTVTLRPQAPEVPAFPVNGGNAGVIAGTTDLRLVISSTPISVFDDTSVTLQRGDAFYTFAASDITVVPLTDNQVFDIAQGNLMVDGSPWIYENGDNFFLKVKGIDLGAYDDNIVWQARDMLIRFGGLVSADFDSNWATYRDKAAPAQSSISTFKSRVWVQESINTLEQVLSMLEQVRLEVFVDRLGKFKINSLHFEDFDDSPTASLKNWDIQRNSFQPKLDERNNFNRAKADYAFSPAIGENKFSTELYRNQSAINQVDGRLISKLITFPNLYIASDVELNLIEIIRLASGYSEFITVVTTPRSILRDIGDFLSIDVDIGNVDYGFQEVVGMIRDIGYNPEGLAIPMKIWSFQMINFPGYSGPTGTVGGFDAVITKET